MSAQKVSILTTIYHHEKHLAACIESVLVSTYQNWELIIVNDQFRDCYFINTNYVPFKVIN
jgi:glycosyltransferase involved in cell wall biosynthesis